MQGTISSTGWIYRDAHASILSRGLDSATLPPSVGVMDLIVCRGGGPASARRPVAPFLVALFAVALLGCSGSDGPAEGAGSSEAGPSSPPSSANPAGSNTTTASSARNPDTTAPAPTDPSGDTAPITQRPVLAQVRVQLHQLARFTEPVSVALRPRDPRTGRVYVVERAGLIKALEPDATVAPEPVADLSAFTLAGGERGLLGLAFSPDGSRMYVNYTDLSGHTNIDELTLTAAGSADPASRRRVLFVEQPYANHNGGHLDFGPDGMLYIGMGDGGSGGDPQGNAQNLQSLLGKMLRINPVAQGERAYSIPADNPFVGRPDARPEIWSYGLRNPWGFSFDAGTGDLWIGDVGQNAIEEINAARAAEGTGRGVNFGWNAFEGTVRFPGGGTASGAVDPVFEYGHGAGADQGCSITGGVVYRQKAVPNLAGAYLYADYCVGGIRAIAATGEAKARLLIDEPVGVVGFGLDADGEVLVLDLGGALYRLEPAP